MKPSWFRASAFEYRFRLILHVAIYALGFWAPWLYWGNIFHFTDTSTWLALSHELSLTGVLNFFAATDAVLVVALVLLAFGAWLRTWGAAYVSTAVVQSPAMHGVAMVADGPFRRTRNPLYLGTLLHTLGIAILMPPSGAVLTVVVLWAFQVRLALAEEPFLTAKFGQPYLNYKARVPRFIPALSPRVPVAGLRPQWLQAILGELYFWGVFLVFVIFGWSFNANPMYRGILVALGVWIVARAFLPKAKTT